MKEHIEYIIDSFTDFKGEVHHFVIAALSEILPTKTCQLEDAEEFGEETEVLYTVNSVIADFGMWGYCGSVEKTLKLGISICNPADEFDETIGKRKALARARANDPVLWAAHSGVINTTMVKALLQQEAKYLKDNPENFIEGYADSKQRWETNQNMLKMREEFTPFENQVTEELEKNHNVLERVMKFLKWKTNQEKGQN